MLGVDGNFIDRRLGIGAVAQRLGVSVRALRLYEAAALIAPARTEAGRRVFSAGDIARLQHVLALKKAGCTLAQIRTVLNGRTIDPASWIDAQIGVLEARMSAAERALKALRAARSRLDASGSMDPTSFCDLIQSGEYLMTEDAWSQVFDRYYTPEEQARFKAAKLAMTPAEQQADEQGWADLIARVERAIEAGEPPDGPVGIGLAQEWMALQGRLVAAVGVQTWNKAARMYQEMADWQSDSLKPPFSNTVWTYMLAAVGAARAQGAVPPRSPSVEG